MTVSNQPGKPSSAPPKENRGGTGKADTGSAPKMDFVSPPAIALPKGGGAVRGIGEKFSANPVTGTGTMSVPLAVSPGRSGFGPQLNLSYDSGSGNGPFGFGWSLSIPSITRKTDKGLPRYQDNEESDVFLLSGAEDLVPVLVRAQGEWVRETLPLRTVDGVTYRVDRYRPRIEGLFARIERWTNTSNTTDVFWRSISRDNILTLYGRDGKSRIFDPANPGHIFSWLICESRDDKGNAIIYEYAEEKDDDKNNVDRAQANERNRVRTANRYLKRIKYGNRFTLLDNNGQRPTILSNTALQSAEWLFEVVFDYGEGTYVEEHRDSRGRVFASSQVLPPADSHWPVRQDPFSSYRAGFEVRTYRLCQRVLMFHHFPQELGVDDYLVRATEFHYKENPVATFLSSVTQSGFLHQPVQGDPNRYRKKSLPPVEFTYSPVPTPEELANLPIREVDAGSLENLPMGLDGSRYQWVDLDGEGLSGILTEQGGDWYYKRNYSANNLVPEGEPDATGRDQFYVAARFGDLEHVASRPALSNLNGGRQQLLDLNGNGQIDLVAFSGATPGFYERTQTEGWESFKSFNQLPNIQWDDPNLRFVDLNGDGHTDALLTEGDVFTWYPSLAEEGFESAERVFQPFDEEKGPRLVFADGTQSIFLADMSGDGLTDLVRIRNGEVCYWPNLGYGRFGSKVTMDDSPLFDRPDLFDRSQIRLADIDGSGLTDILYLGSDGVHFYYNQSGNRWSQANPIPQFPRVDDLTSVQVLDLLGTGTACLVWSSSLPGDTRIPMRYIDLMNGMKPHLLIETNNNLGGRTEVTYAPSTKFYLADKLAGKPWITRLSFPVHVVEKVTAFDKWRKTQFSSTYSYHHGYFDGVEREFRGFGRVEQVDIEDYGPFSQGNIDSPYITQDLTLYQPPIKTITWFHTGAFFDRERILSQFADEYFPNQFSTVSGFTEKPLPESDLSNASLSAEEWREALRACKGMTLRQEIYELKVDSLHENQKHEPVRLFSTAMHNCNIRRLQPMGTNRHAVFLVTESEAITYNYELDLEKDPLEPDPRIAHSLTLKTNQYGQPQQTIAVVYPRVRQFQDDTPSIKPFPINLEETVRKVQGERHIAYAETHYTNELPHDPDQHRLPVPCEVFTYELTGNDRARGFVPGLGLYFTLEDFKSFALSDTLPDQGTKAIGSIAYHQQPPDEKACKRPVERVRTLYFKDDLSGPQPLGFYAWRGLTYESYKLALTSDLLTSVFGIKLNEIAFQENNQNFTGWDILAAPNRSGYLKVTGLVDSSGNPAPDEYWLRSGTADFEPDAAQHFYLPERYEDPFGNRTTLAYDGRYDLFVKSSTDPAGNTVTIKEFDYRVLTPQEMVDINDNHTAVAFDVLGLPIGSAVMGKVSNGQTESGDSLSGFQADLDLDEVMSFFSGAYSSQMAATWLGNATARFVYSFGEQLLNNKLTYGQVPACACGILREQHVNQLNASGGALKDHIQTGFEYSDGSGQVLVKKAQAEPEPGGTGLRWIASGKIIFNNKGKAVKQYEPYFSTNLHKYKETREVGVTPVMYYDAAGRLVRTELPDGTFSRVEFSPWHVKTFDANDTVLQSDWYKRRTDLTHPKYPEFGSAENRRAARLAADHANSPAVTHLDSLGRDVIAVAHNKYLDQNNVLVEERYVTFTKLDAEGKPLWIKDALGHLVMQYVRPYSADNKTDPSGLTTCYDIAGNLLFQHSMDAGDRWMLMDAASQPLLAWDANEFQGTSGSPVMQGRLYFSEYDALRRPVNQWLTIDQTSRLLVELFDYGEGLTDAKVRNLRGQLHKHYDPAGLAQVERIDFKGNPLEVQRQLVRDHTASVTDWQTNPSARLDFETYHHVTEYDALNRMTRLYNWHQGVGRQVAVYEPRYNERGLLFSEELVVRANRNSAANGKRYDEIPGQSRREQAIREIHYNEKGQKEYVVHGNSTITRYDYDPESFRLRQLRTTRPNYDPPFTGTHSGLVNPQVLQQLNYTYDPVGNITEIYDEAYEPVFFDNQQVNPVNQYIYDALYRLIQASGRENGAANGAPTQLEDPPVEVDFPIPSGALRNYTEAYRYDSAGNIHEMEHVGGSNGNWTRHYGYASDSNRLLRTWERANHWNDSNATNKIEYQYDTHGSMLNTNNVAPGQYLQWDHRDMIKSIDLVGGGIAYYQYDSGKQRTRKVIENNPGTGRWERIYLGGFELYRRYNSTSSQPVEEIETYHLFEGEQRLLLVDDVISTTKKHADGSPYITGPHFRYQYSNHLGSACLELDDQTEIISYEEYHPYGTSAYRAVKRNIEAPPKRYRYTGMERDEESGLSYHTARYYLSRLGRWVSVDSSGIEEGTNLYHFCSGEPIGRVDLNGNSDNSETKIVKPAMQKVLPKNTATEFQVRWTDPKTGITHVLRIDIAIPPQNELMCFDVFGEYKGTPKKSGKPSTQTEGQIPFHEAIKSPTGADVIVDSNKALPGSGFQNTKGKTANFQEGKNFVFIDNENVSQVQRGTADVYGTNKPGVKVRRAGESPAKPAQGNPVKPTPVAAVKSTTQTPPKPAAPAATVKPTTQTPPEPAAPAATVKPTTQATSKVAASTKPATLDAPANLPKGTGTKVKLTRTPGNSVTAPVAGGALVLMELMMDEDTKQGMGIACEMALLAIADRTHPGDPTQKYIEKIIRANKEPTLADKELLERHDIAFVGMKEGKAYWQIGGVIKRNVNIGF